MHYATIILSENYVSHYSDMHSNEFRVNGALKIAQVNKSQEARCNNNSDINCNKILDEGAIGITYALIKDKALA